MVLLMTRRMKLRMIGNESLNGLRVPVKPDHPVARSQSLGDLQRVPPTSKRAIDYHQRTSVTRLGI